MRKLLNLLTISLAILAALAQKPASAGDHEHDWETVSEVTKRCSCDGNDVGVRHCTVKRCWCGMYRTTCGECKACGPLGQY